MTRRQEPGSSKTYWCELMDNVKNLKPYLFRGAKSRSVPGVQTNKE
jgi:hypothetical protein